MVALLDHVFRLFGATVLQLGDVEQPLDARDDFDERAERRRALHDAFVDPADFRLLHEAGYHISGPLRRLADTRNRDHPRILDVDLGTRLLLDTADRLALGTDEVADLVGPDLNREDAGRVLGQLRTRPWHRLMHDVQDVQARGLGLFERFANDFPVELLDLDVHLDRRHAGLCPRDLEIHIPDMILSSKHISLYRGPSVAGNNTRRYISAVIRN